MDITDDFDDVSFGDFLSPTAPSWPTREIPETPASRDGTGYIRNLVARVRSVLVPDTRSVAKVKAPAPSRTCRMPQVALRKCDAAAGFEFTAAGRMPEDGAAAAQPRRADGFRMKSFLVTRPRDTNEESYRKARLHAIASGAEKVLPMPDPGRFLFVNSMDRAVTAKRILEKLGYHVESFLFHFEPDKLVRLEDMDGDSWHHFVEELGKLSQLKSLHQEAPLAGTHVWITADIAIGCLHVGMPRATDFAPKPTEQRLLTDAFKPCTEVLRIRGPGNSAFLVEMRPSKHVYEVRFLLKNLLLGKHRCKFEESGMPEFERNGYITTEPLSDYEEQVERAGQHSNAVGADKVIPLKNSRQLQFVCQPERLPSTARKLKLFGYEIHSTGVTYYPLNLVYLGRKDRLACERFLRDIAQLSNVVRIYDNIYR